MKARAKRLTRPKVSYVTQGQRKIAVQMKIADFQTLMERMEDLQDALELKEAVRKSTGFVTLEQFKKEVAALRKR